MPTPISRLKVSLLILGMTILPPLIGQTAALAQAPACERYKAELASLNRSGASSRQAEANAQRHAREIERLAGYYRAIGCDRSGFFFSAPAECGPIAGQIRALQGSYQSLVGQAVDPSAANERRRQLRAAISRACDSTEPESLPATKLNGNGRLVCVRSCDGSYFPLDGEPKRNGGEAALCSALCPNTEVRVFLAPREGGIEEAVSQTGEPYMRLPNALRYRKAYDPSCACKKPDESWAQALRKAENLIARKKSDILVTEAISQQMTNAALKRPRTKRDKADAPVVTAASTIRPAALADPETTGSVAADPPPGQARTIRVIAPDIIPVPTR